MSAAELVGTGIIMGTLHVLTGPDHLSALATLSATDLSSRSKPNEMDALVSSPPQSPCDYRAFLLGVRWGIGHSVGLLIVGGSLISFQEGTRSEEWVMLNGWVFTMLETFVGLFMLGLGTYGVAKALMNREYISTVMGSMEMAKRRHSSRLTMAAGNKKKNKASVKNPLVMTGGEDLLDLPPRQENSLDDQMADALGDTVLVHTNFDDTEGDKTCELNDADRRIWNAAKSPSNTDNIMMYASEDEMSCGKSHSESVVTIPMSTSIMADLQRLYDEQGDGVSDSDSVESGKNLRHLFDDGDVEVHPIPRSSRHDDYPSSFKAPLEQNRFLSKFPCLTPGTLALMTGIIHGVAGPGGVLGIVPAVQMQDARLAATYLGTFCLTSTFVMGGFAASYGRMCKWLARRDGNEKDESASWKRVFLIEFGSACLSIIVGIVWLTLLAVGELDEVFP